MPLLIMSPRWFLPLLLSGTRMFEAIADESHPLFDALERGNERIEMLHQVTPHQIANDRQDSL
jgi:hypothetical protein